MNLAEQIKELQKQIDDLREARDVVFVESLKKRVLGELIESGVVENPGADLNEVTTIDTLGDGVFHTDQYDKRVRVTINGTDYYIGLYNT